MMQIVYRAENIIDANLVKGLLEQEGIRAFVNGSYLQGGVGELPAAGLVTVSVTDSDVGGAATIVEQFSARTAADPNDKTRWDTLPDGLQHT